MLFFPQEMKNSRLNPLMGKFPVSCQDLKQEFLPMSRGFSLNVDQDPG